MAITLTVDGQTIIRDWAQQCADCDYLHAMKGSGDRRRKTCKECGSPDLVSTYITDCPRCGLMVPDSAMAEHIMEHLS